MKAVRAIISTFLVAVSLTATLVTAASPAQADAASGTCAAGYRLGSYSSSIPAYNLPGQLMWKISWRKRWCYNVTSKRVGTVYAPKPTVSIYFIFGSAWRYRGIVDSDSYYTSRDARGYVHRNYLCWGHVSWHKVKMDHCAVKYAICTSHYYKVGIISYWDGSKKLILP